MSLPQRRLRSLFVKSSYFPLCAAMGWGALALSSCAQEGSGNGGSPNTIKAAGADSNGVDSNGSSSPDDLRGGQKPPPNGTPKAEEDDSDDRNESGDRCGTPPPSGGTPWPTPTGSPRPSPSITPTPTPTSTPSICVIQTPTPTPTPSFTPTPTSTPTVSPTMAGTPSPTPTDDPVIITVFHNETLGKLDLLWVVDNSGSMNWAQARLAEQFGVFAQRLKDAGVDVHVAMTSLDMCTPGSANPMCPDARLIQGQPLMGRFVNNAVLSNGPTFVQDFSNMARLGASGSGYEQGLRATSRAIELAKVSKNNCDVNANFLRPDAKLAVVLVSDEEDDGVQFFCRNSLTGAQDCSKYGDYFGNPAYGTDPAWKDKFGPGKIEEYTPQKFVADVNKNVPAQNWNFHAITGIRGADGKIDLSNCPVRQSRPGDGDDHGGHHDAPQGGGGHDDGGGHGGGGGGHGGGPTPTPRPPEYRGPKEEGTNYLKAAELTGGTQSNICSNWSTTLLNLGAAVSNFANKVPLDTAKRPYTSTIEVHTTTKTNPMEGDFVQQSSDSWVYDGNTNAVIFKKAPQKGTRVRIRYKRQ